MNKSSLSLILLLLVGCAVGPNYHPPEISFSDDWSVEKLTPSADLSSEIDPAWWNIFQDNLLTQYVEKAAQANYDLQAAQARILEARALRMVTASQLFPQIIGDFNASRTYFSKNGPVFAGQSLTAGTSNITGLPFILQIPQTQNLFNALLDTSWEIDLFGKTRRAIEAADANIETSIAQKDALLLTICAEVASNYIDIRSNQQLGLLVEQNIALLESQVEIEKQQFEKGYHDKIPLENLLAQLAQEQASLPAIHAQIYQGIYALSTLVGEPPEGLMDELLPLSSLPPIPRGVALGLRSDILRRRPDVREAERQIAAATANVGVAVASFFPTISLSADLGLQAMKLINLFQSRSKTWSVGGDANVPIFQGGQLVGNLRATRASAAAALHMYQQTVLNALQEAESSLVTFESAIKSFDFLKEATEKTQSIQDITESQEVKGLINKSQLIDSQRNRNIAEQNQLKSQSQALTSLIALYKSLGGGWELFDSNKNN